MTKEEIIESIVEEIKVEEHQKIMENEKKTVVEPKNYRVVQIVDGGYGSVSHIYFDRKQDAERYCKKYNISNYGIGYAYVEPPQKYVLRTYKHPVRRGRVLKTMWILIEEKEL